MFERVLIDHGDQKTVMTIGKPGILWKLDRVTGKFLAAKETIFQNVFAKIDHKTGAVTYRKDICNQKTNEWYSSCPGPEGGHDWQATSYYQPDDLLIIPLSQSCVMIQGHDVDMKLGGGGTAASQKFFFMPGTHQNMGKLVAYRTTDMKEMWSWQQRSPFLTGGAVHRRRRRLRRRLRPQLQGGGRQDRQDHVADPAGQHGAGLSGVSFSLDGKQYIAVTTAWAAAARSRSRPLLDEVHRAVTGQQLYVFGLPD